MVSYTAANKRANYTPEQRLEFRKNWIRALESGEFNQGQNSLIYHVQAAHPGPLTFYCCIGVECNVNGVSVEDYGSVYSYCHFRERVEPNPLYAEYLASHLIAMNDERNRDFPFIARFLRKVWQIED